MSCKLPTIKLEYGLDLRQMCTSGSVLHINEDYDEEALPQEFSKEDSNNADFIGGPVKCFKSLEKQLTAVDSTGLVKKKVIDQGGGMPINEKCTIYIAYTGFWENTDEPFDVRKIHKPLIVDMNSNDIVPGILMAVQSMLVGETSVFFLSYKVMFGEMGVPPRIKSRADCVFYIKLLKSIITPIEGEINFSESNMFQRVFNQVVKLYSSGLTLHKTKNYTAAIQLFKKSVFMLHKCRLANEFEERKQEKMLKKLYLNLAVCHNKLEQPLKACVACNELNRLDNLWNNGKALYHNAKALRMIGQFDAAEKRLLRAIKLCPASEDIEEEYKLLEKTRNACDQNRLIVSKLGLELISNHFKKEVDDLIKNFKDNPNLCKLTLPGGLNTVETDYIKEACMRENLFYNRIKKDYALDKTNDQESTEADSEEPKETVTLSETNLDQNLLEWV